MNLRPLWFGLALAVALPASAARFAPDLRDIDAVPLHALPAAAVAHVLEKTPARKDGPLIFASAVDLPMGLDGGAWSAQDGTAIWRSRVFSTGATLLLLLFDRFALPADAALYLYDPEGRIVQGPLTAADATKTGQLWTPFVRGEQLVMELRVPAAQRSAVDLHLAKVYHGFVDVMKAGGIAKSGSCNIDVACAQGEPWRDEIRAVMRLQIPLDDVYAALCTGTLVNNVRQDERPFVLSANHCEIDEDSAQGIVSYWNYETSVCGGTPDGSETSVLVGASFVDADERSDFALIELDDRPPAAFAPYFAGWYVGSATPRSGVTIHHPSGDEKRISLFESAAQRVEVEVDDVLIDSWQVYWSQGTTEQGSSGAALWNQDHRIVGVLSGGEASCNTPDNADYYGRLELAWDRGLDRYLDPDHTGLTSLCGTDPGEDCDTGVDDTADDDGGGGAVSLRLLGLLAAAALGRRRIARRRATHA